MTRKARQEEMMAATAMVISEPSLRVPATETVSALERISNQLFECTTVLEVKDASDKAEAIRTWARLQRGGEALHRDATVVLTRAERRLGELMKPSTEESDAARVLSERRIQLEEAGVKPYRIDRAKKLASIPPAKFERTLGQIENPTPGRVLRETGADVQRYTAPALREERVQLYRMNVAFHSTLKALELALRRNTGRVEACKRILRAAKRARDRIGADLQKAAEDCPGSAELTQELITNYLHHDDDPDGIVAAARGGQ